MKILFELFIGFFKTGLLTFGGGYAMLPLLKDEFVTKRAWLSEDELLNYFSIGSCTPGIIAVNVATFCGYKLKKTIGAMIATFGLVLPSMIVVTLIAGVFSTIAEHPDVKHILGGVRVGIVAVLLKVVYDICVKIYHTSKNKILPALIFCAALLGLVVFKVSAVVVVLCALGVGVAPLFVQYVGKYQK